MTREEAIKILRDTHDKALFSVRNALETLIPDFRESDDERIRKTLLCYHKNAPEQYTCGGLTHAEVVAWLEKQKEQKPADNVSKEEYVKRFKALCDAYEIKLPNREYDIYHLCDDLSKLSIDSGKQKPAEWSRDDTQHRNKILLDLRNMQARYAKDKMKNWKDADFYDCCMKDNGENIEWLESLPERFNLQPKQELNEEDEQAIGFIFDLLNDLVWRKDWAMSKEECLERLKSLRPVKQEWSEEDEHRKTDAIYFLESAKKHYADTSEIEKTIAWLKSLRPSWKPGEQEKGALRTAIYVLTDERNFPKTAAQLQNILNAFEGKESRKDWKPSEEQMETLERWLLDNKFKGDSRYVYPIFESLYDDLKKLM